MFPEDFKTLGVALADARLLVEKFKVQKRQEELASMVAAVRGNSCERQTKRKKGNAPESNVKVEYSWHNYDLKKSKFVALRLGQGGGLRDGSIKMDWSLQRILKDICNKYFPNDKSATGLKLDQFDINLLGPDKKIITDLSQSVQQFYNVSGFRVKKFYLATKKKHWTSLVTNESDDDSLKDFDIKKDLCAISTPKPVSERIDNQSQGQTPKPVSERDDSQSLRPDEVYQNQLERRRELIRQQDEEFKASVSADQRKAEQRRIEQEREEKRLEKEIEEKRIEQERKEKRQEYLLERQRRRKDLVPEEAALEDHSLVVAVIHVSLARVTRFFWEHNRMADVYNWVGSLSPTPELFELFVYTIGNSY